MTKTERVELLSTLTLVRNDLLTVGTILNGTPDGCQFSDARKIELTEIARVSMLANLTDAMNAIEDR